MLVIEQEISREKSRGERERERKRDFDNNC